MPADRVLAALAELDEQISKATTAKRLLEPHVGIAADGQLSRGPGIVLAAPWK